MIQYAWQVTTPPTVEPLSLAEAKLHLGIGDAETQWDGYLPELVKAARSFTERRANVAMLNQTVTLNLDCFPQVIRLPIGPVSAITSIKYYDTAGVQQTLAGANYECDFRTKPARIRPAYLKSWPTTRDTFNAVEVIFPAGYGAASTAVPPDLIHAVKLLLSHWFENREAVGSVGGPVAIAFNAIVDNFRIRLCGME
jgi:uncharacterized phiE125 gp8 family phage protein